MGPPPPRAQKAMNVMKDFGFSTRDVKPVLKELMRVYENNWELIEENGYQVLIDRILEVQDSKGTGDTNQDGTVCNEPDTEPVRKRLKKQDEMQISSPMLASDGLGESSDKKQKSVAGDFLDTSITKRNMVPVSPLMAVGGKEPGPASEHPLIGGEMLPQSSHLEDRDTGSGERDEPVSPLIARRQTRASARTLQSSPTQDMSESPLGRTYRRLNRPLNESMIEKQPKIEPGTEVIPGTGSAAVPLRIKDEPVIDEVPIAIVRPPPPDMDVADDEGHQPQLTQTTSSESSKGTQNADNGNGNRKASPANASCEKGKTSELVSVHKPSSSNINVASSGTGEVNISITCNSDPQNFHMPNLDTVFKMVEERCLKSYKFLPPDFSVMKVMKEICQCVWEMGSESNASKQENIVKLAPALDSLKKSGVRNMLDGMPECSSFDSLKSDKSEGSKLVQMNGHCGNQGVNENAKCERRGKRKEPLAPEDSSSNSLVVSQQPQVALGDVRPPHDVTDISRGEERIRISLVNDVSSEKYPSCFYYIPHNMAYQSAYVNFSLARIGDEDCCSDCYGDCLAAIPCACARETGGEFAYTSDSLVKDAFLDECISMNREPQKHQQYYCKVCPLERSKKDLSLAPCKGHLVRKFIKECWSKCGCNKQCGNRVVQRGITCNLQVFFTPEGKGWGVRTLDELPKGSFVCEYVGEVLTNTELYSRTVQSTGNAKHTYPVLLDADWGSEGVLKDEEALCLDATFYGNVARFVNHRCFDANLVEIPVEVETPDRHYYHLAFFTTRKVEPYEELTWDYGIDFDDHGHPIKAFKCRCGSKFCRDMKRSKARSKAVVMK
ncbi:putative inactive histone-lysine N-methyltransferase SUVR1 isoform X1 [Iris pallida]|uniref:Inactive histone-lysine N-methyltransferase SUVR1 isoform X1 n=1 Tax=Iris pallida TaxID=29817 RepID=A0AAX6G1K1_IRIPA|nr:putative inactive histone-lysine N-methyltransferase SUVR1 isoform X1 [Iris pallida]KAJ6844894.1 putative inactive histone-lysine N-methyltransferase SUVR1 isoform X1 [Iris pallida]